jgi:hypothetical protein
MTIYKKPYNHLNRLNNWKKENPLLAGLINFFVWGAGYLYLWKKHSFGYGLLLVALLEHSPLMILGIGIIVEYPYYLYLVGHLVLSTILAYDAYFMAIDLDPNHSVF